MKNLIAVLILNLSLFANLDIFSFESNFTQKIVDSSSKVVKYYGKLYFKKPMKVLWIYQKPIKKSIYILYDKVIIIEPEIEQVTIKRVGNPKNIIDILKKAKQIDKNRYETIFEGQKYTIYTDNKDRLKKLIYKDKMDNLIEIEFYKIKQNKKIEDKIFSYKIDPNFDVIFQ